MEHTNKKIASEKAVKKEEKFISGGHVAFEPKFIRGPTDYQVGEFRSVQSNPALGESLESIGLKEGQNDDEAPLLKQAFESENSDLSVGTLKNQDKVLVGTQKNKEDRKVNTYNKKNVQLSRAKKLYPRNYETYSEDMNQGFCFFIPNGAVSEVFLRYLEEAAKQSETEKLTEVFPFLETEMLKNQLEALMAQRASLRGEHNGLKMGEETAVKALDYQIDQVRIRIYDHQLKKIQFKKQLQRVLTVENKTVMAVDSEEFWLFLWLKKLLELLEDDGDATWKAKGF